MITALLTFAFVGSLFYGQMPQPYLLILCAGLGIFLAVAARHRYSPFISVDVIAQTSRLKNINPALKFWTLFSLMIICVISKNSATGIFLLITAGILAVAVSGLKLRQYIHFLALPVSFLLIGGLALLYEISPEPTGVLNLHIFGWWLCVGIAAQAKTALVVARAFGAVSCLCLIGITTPMPDIIGILRRARCPALIIDLMYL
ncbi:MAG: hypothetical protein FWF22_11160, partial [Treponema sp.]|nr:hypothetical protein [Treponema sp.]